jgi:hypothetical protein
VKTKTKEANKIIDNLKLLKKIGELQVQRSFSKGRFTFGITNREINIDGFTFAPGESDRVKQLLGIAGNMAKFEALPPEIKSTPFQVSFGEEGTHTLHKTEKPKGVEFSFGEVDELIKAITMAFDISVDLTKINPVATPGAVYGEGMGDVYEGRG